MDDPTGLEMMASHTAAFARGAEICWRLIFSVINTVSLPPLVLFLPLRTKPTTASPFPSFLQ